MRVPGGELLRDVLGHERGVVSQCNTATRGAWQGRTTKGAWRGQGKVRPRRPSRRQAKGRLAERTDVKDLNPVQVAEDAAVRGPGREPALV